jgi:hypothetical protein
MDFFLLFKFMHVAAAIAWIGSIVCLIVLATAANSRQDKAEFARIMQNIVFLAPRLFVPVSSAALVLGVIATWMSYGFRDLWIIIGVVGFAATFVTGNFMLRPRAEKITALVARDGVSNAVLAVGGDLLALAKFDTVVLFVVVADMVFKPVPEQWPVLALMALAIVAGAVGFLMPVMRAQSSAEPAAT